jgi:hypothetical protein
MSKGHYYLIAIFSILFFASLLTPLAHASSEQVIIQQTSATASIYQNAQIIKVNQTWIITGFKIYIWANYTTFDGIKYGIGKIKDITDINHTHSILYYDIWKGSLQKSTWTWLRFNFSVRVTEGYYFLFAIFKGTLPSSTSYLIKCGGNDPYQDGTPYIFVDTTSPTYFKTPATSYDWTMYVYATTDPTTIITNLLPAIITIAMLGVALGLMSKHLKY